MRKLFALVIVVFGFVTISGCGGPKAVTPTAPATDPPKSAIGVSGGPVIPNPPK